MASKGISAGDCLTYGITLSIAAGILGGLGVALSASDLGLVGVILLALGSLVGFAGLLTLQVGVIAKGVQIGRRG